MKSTTSTPVRLARGWTSSPVGPLELVADERGLREVAFGPWPGAREQDGETDASGTIPEAGTRPVDEPGDAPAAALEHLRQARRQLEQYFAGRRQVFELSLSLRGTPFQKEVWQALTQVPYGSTSSYGAIARAVGRPRASRAVGAANGANPLAIVVPCHRVVGANGTLTGYGGGLDRKRRLLELEAGGARVAG